MEIAAGMVRQVSGPFGFGAKAQFIPLMARSCAYADDSGIQRSPTMPDHDDAQPYCAPERGKLTQDEQTNTNTTVH